MGSKLNTPNASKGIEFIIYPHELFTKYVETTKSVPDLYLGETVEDFDKSYKNCIKRPLSYIDVVSSVKEIRDHESWDLTITPDQRFECDSLLQKKCIDITSFAAERFNLICHYCFNLHDRDLGRDLQPLKNHYHVLIFTEESNQLIPESVFQYAANVFNQVVYKKSVLDEYHSKKYDRDEKLFQSYHRLLSFQRSKPIYKLNSAIRYQIHIDNRDKELYLLENVKSDLDLFRHQAFRDACKQSQLNFLIDSIDNGLVHNFRELYHYALLNGCLDCFTKFYWIILNYAQCKKWDNVEYTSQSFIQAKTYDHLNPLIVGNIDSEFNDIPFSIDVNNEV